MRCSSLRICDERLIVRTPARRLRSSTLSKPAYDVQAVDLGEITFEVTPARPTNYTRSAFHVVSGAASLALIRLLPGRGWLVAASLVIATAAWTMEAMRRCSPATNDRLMRLFAPVAHAHERHRVNSSTWYVTALVLLAAFFPLRASAIGVVVLAVADPAAGFIGRRFGRTRIRAGRSVEGTLAFVVAGTLAALGALSLCYAVPVPVAVLLGATGAIAGAIAELVSLRLDDNFTIPLTAALATSLLPLFVAGT